MGKNTVYKFAESSAETTMPQGVQKDLDDHETSIKTKTFTTLIFTHSSYSSPCGKSWL